MIVRRRTYPWEHLILEEVFKEDDYQKMLDFHYGYLPLDDLGNYRDADNKWIRIFDTRDLKKTEPEITQIVRGLFYGLCDKIGLKDLREDPDYILKIQLDACTDDYEYPIHTDTENKFASLLVYIGDNGVGTLLHENETDPAVVEAPYKDNCGLFFKRGENTWHSYNCEGNQIRRTFNIVLWKR